MRLSEATGLSTDDVYFDEEVPYVDINPIRGGVLRQRVVIARYR